MVNHYELLDSGDELKLERFGDVVLVRPCGQAQWAPARPALWSGAHATYTRDTGWVEAEGVRVPERWTATIDGIAFALSLTPAGHVGVFPETRELWGRIGEWLSPDAESLSVLNLFAYSGGATLAAARAGSAVCHVDASKSMVTRARDNAALNGLGNAPIRWIVDDVGTFLGREIRRGRRYDAIMLDPPSFGRGTKGEQYRFDRDLSATLEQCKALLSDKPAFVLLTAHTQGVTAGDLEDRMAAVLGSGAVERGEMRLTGAADVRAVPDGVWVRWSVGS